MPAHDLANPRTEATAATIKRQIQAVYQIGTISGINTSKIRNFVSAISKAKAEVATMCAWKGLGPAAGTTTINAIEIAIVRINTRSSPCAD